ncbi:hypothetical protein ABZ135_23290 [Streptomyces sp. NPDC006339]|uniref:hypothetical protein n=1 Tax=Streptomyces sp. NPDC006339 TaxID=3156755 RepID=UPI0033B361C8
MSDAVHVVDDGVHLRRPHATQEGRSEAAKALLEAIVGGSASVEQPPFVVGAGLGGLEFEGSAVIGLGLCHRTAVCGFGLLESQSVTGLCLLQGIPVSGLGLFESGFPDGSMVGFGLLESQSVTGLCLLQGIPVSGLGLFESGFPDGSMVGFGLGEGCAVVGFGGVEGCLVQCMSLLQSCAFLPVRDQHAYRNACEGCEGCYACEVHDRHDAQSGTVPRLQGGLRQPERGQQGVYCASGAQRARPLEADARTDKTLARAAAPDCSG